MKCEYCEIIERKDKAQILYEDNDALIILKDLVAIPGQITVIPKQHFTILEMVPDSILNKCVVLAQKVGAAVFDSLSAEGTNLLIQNGLGAGQKVPHFAIEVIPRRDGDGLNFQWPPKPLAEDEIDFVYTLLKEEGEKIVIGKDESKSEQEKNKNSKKEEKGVITATAGETEIKLKKEGDNYLLKSLKRVP
ncbi:MAG: HIT family protein [Nanoarchaeota archaeon]